MSQLHYVNIKQNYRQKTSFEVDSDPEVVKLVSLEIAIVVSKLEMVTSLKVVAKFVSEVNVIVYCMEIAANYENYQNKTQLRQVN